MGKGKKKFIEKGDGQHFHVMHRSQRDEAYMKEEEPSNFVLVPTSDTHREKASQLGIESIELHASKALETSKDHINALGFKNDGYDYTQHLKVIGKIEIYLQYKYTIIC